jgi:hypothetical protein
MAPGKPADEFGPYRVIRQIGSGGMASIFEATDTRLGHRVAIKRLHPHVAGRPGATERFLREGRAAARVRHPHVVQVFALGSEGENAYLAMELLEGCDLGAALAREGRLSIEDALELLLPVTAAVATAHDAGVIHRDLKPSNVFVSRGPGGRKWPKVVDFGVSKVLSHGDAGAITATDGVLGTAAYMAPEQARAVRDASFRSDQYSLAVILYECVTGQPPFSGNSVYDLFSAIMTAPVVLPSQRIEGIPAAFDAIVLRAMSRDPRHRFPSTRAFGAALLAFARPQDQAAWGAELQAHSPEHASLSAVPPELMEASVGGGGEPAAPATIAPTVRDTRVSAARRRGARRAAVGILVSATLAVTGVAWVVGRREGLPAADLHPTTTVPPRDSAGPSSPAAPELAAEAHPDAAPSPDSMGPASPSATAAPSRALALGPPRRLPRLMGRASASAAASASPTPPLLGDNGAPILP